MIAWALLLILAGLSLGMLIWGVWSKEHFYQYPTLAGAAWFFFMVPQAVGALIGPSKFPAGVTDDSGIEIALIMCILCAGAGWLGYKSRHWQRLSRFSRPAYYAPSRLFNAGVLLYLISFYGAYRLAGLTGGFIEQFARGGGSSLEWRGLPVMYSFFSQMMYPAILLCLLGSLRRSNIIRNMIVAIFCLYPICVTVFLGRRSQTAFLALIFLLSLFFVKKWAPPRSVCIAGGIFMAFFIVIAPQYRTIAQFGLNMEEFRQIEVHSSFDEILAGKTYVEFDALVINSAAINRFMEFGFGAGFYNSTIAQLVPRQIVGEELKESLFLPLEDPLNASRFYGWEMPYGSNPTGPLNAFSEFWFFGALLYYVIGIISRFIWEQATQFGNVKAQVWYVIWSMLIPTSIVGCLFIIPGQLLTFYVFLAALLWYAGRKARRKKAADPQRALVAARQFSKGSIQ
jgi:oligosaccharide repeat unit polymerase